MEMVMEKFLQKVTEYLENYSEWFAEAPLAATIIIFVAGFALGTLSANVY